MSAPEQPSQYKRRSSGKRSRRSSRPVAAVESVENGAQDQAAVEAAPARSQAKQQQQQAQPKFYQRIIDMRRFEGFQRFVRDAWSEIKKVIWPDRMTTRNLTLLVMALSVVLGILLGGIDYVLYQVFEAMT